MVLGLPTARYNREFMLGDVRGRIARYEHHFASAQDTPEEEEEEGAGGARLFLESELAILRGIEAWLEGWTDDEAPLKDEVAVETAATAVVASALLGLPDVVQRR